MAISSRVDRSLALPFLGRTGLALILLFAINTLFALFPLRVLEPAWQLRVGEVLRTTGPFPLLGVALLYLCKRIDPAARLPLLQIRKVRRLAPLAAAGFLLLIPLQIHATWTQIRTADLEAAKTLRAVQRRVDGVKNASSAVALQQAAQGLPPTWMPSPGNDLEKNRRRLLARIEPELASLQTNSRERKQQAIEQALQICLRDSLLSLVFATTFQSLRASKRGHSRDDEDKGDREMGRHEIDDHEMGDHESEGHEIEDHEMESPERDHQGWHREEQEEK